MSKQIYVASGYCDHAVKANTPRDAMMTHLEDMLGDEVTLLAKGDHHEIWMVYDDSQPSELIYKLPRDYK